ncbi:hypothetical protein [Acinetobacter sp.]|uniref:hypothetical protein n=1 Tax=Acinetobacter sp. TaxID=472 RepID=UPI0028A6348D|nr:hypothetical protein [Acinetobacter sp.]
MSDFEKWFEDQDFYTNMRFIHGDKLFDKDGAVYRVLPVQMTYQGWSSQRQRSKDEFVELTQEWHTKGWNARQGEIEKLENELSTTKQVLGNVIDMEVAKVDSLKAQLNNMEACYIEKKKQVEDQQKKVDEVLEYLDGESANRWGLWKEKADMLDQGASNAFEEAYWMAKKALRGAND